MIIARWDGGVRIELDMHEAEALADYLDSFGASHTELSLKLWEQLDEIIKGE